LGIALKKLFIGTYDTIRCPQEAFAGMVIARPANQRSNRFFGFFPAGATAHNI
jgi:hypothetical protein